MLALVAIVGVNSPAAAADLYVAPTGVRTNDGSQNRPLDLATALSAASPARPGDTIWLRGGTYVGNFTSRIQGTASAPITVRQFPGERATLDGAGSRLDLLTVQGQWVVFWGFELTNSDPRRRANETGPWPYDLHRGAGIVAIGPNLKFINLVFHDLAYGIGVWEESVNTEVYGSVIYHNGWEAPDRGHGHGIYTQNRYGHRVIRDNIIFNSFSHGIHAYGSEVAHLDNITIEGNVSFNNGILSTGGFQRDILLGGARAVQNPVLRDNFTYGGGLSRLGLGADCVNAIVEGNYFVGSSALILEQCVPVMRNNTFYGSYAAQYGWGSLKIVPQNTYNRLRPTTNFVAVRRNHYESGRGHIVAYNWTRANFITVDLSPVQLQVGDQFEIRDAQNYFGAPVLTGIYSGQPITVPMNGLAFTPPLGDVPVAPAHTAPEFAVFVVMSAQGLPEVPPETVAPPAFTPPAGTITAPVSVTLSSATPGAAIRFTTDGSTPSGGSPLYTGPFSIAATTTVMARAFASGMTESPVVVATYTRSQLDAPAAPAISPPGGTFTAPVAVTLTGGPTTTIRYSVDGSTPTIASTPYSGTLTLSATTVLKARAFSATLAASEVSTATFSFAPRPPSGLTALAVSANQINLQWSANADSMRIERCSGAGCTSFSQIAQTTPNVLLFHDSGLAAGMTYRYRLVAVAGNVTSAPSNVVEVTTRPSAPASLSATTAGSHNVLRWNDTTGETAFRIERCIGAACTAFTTLAQMNANVVSYSDPVLTPSATHRYRVFAVNAAGDSTASNIADTTPPPSSTGDLIATALSTTQIALTWAPSPSASGYGIERCTNAGCASFGQIAQVAAGVTSFTDSGVWSGVMYRYRVRAFSNAGPANYSNAASATTLPYAPRALTVAASQTHTVLRWVDDAHWETGFRIERCQGAGCTAFIPIGQAGANAATFTDAGVTPSALYRYRVFSLNAGGDSQPSNIAETTTLPNTPARLSAIAVSASRIDLTWEVVAGASGYRIERCATAGCSSFSTIGEVVGTNVTTFANGGLWANVLYRYRVRAFNSGGSSSSSAVAEAATATAAR